MYNIFIENLGHNCQYIWKIFVTCWLYSVKTLSEQQLWEVHSLVSTSPGFFRLKFTLISNVLMKILKSIKYSSFSVSKTMTCINHGFYYVYYNDFILSLRNVHSWLNAGMFFTKFSYLQLSQDLVTITDKNIL